MHLLPTSEIRLDEHLLVRQAGGEAAGEELYQDVWMTLVRHRDSWTPTAALKKVKL